MDLERQGLKNIARRQTNSGVWSARTCPAPYTHFANRIGDWFGYPKGIVSSSPGLAPRACPGKVVGGFLNPNGVVTRPPLALGLAATPLGLMPIGDAYPGWRRGRNPGLEGGIPLGFGERTGPVEMRFIRLQEMRVRCRTCPRFGTRRHVAEFQSGDVSPHSKLHHSAFKTEIPCSGNRRGAFGGVASGGVPPRLSNPR